MEPREITSAASLETPEEAGRILDALRRAIPLNGMAVATEETYLGWASPYLRSCHERLGRSPADAGPPAITAYLEFLALERNVAPATQKQTPHALEARLRQHLERTRQNHLDDLAGGAAHLPESLIRKYPNAPRQ